MKNSPSLWLDSFPLPQRDDHKYTRGQVSLLGGVEMTGATCLAAHAASRVGAGLVTIISPTFHYKIGADRVNPTLVYRSFKPHIIVKDNTSFTDHMKHAGERGRNVCVIGPGLGQDEAQLSRTIVLNVLEHKTPVVLDADALNIFSGNPKELFNALHDDVVITPHSGEFRRLFPNIGTKGKDAAMRASQEILGTLVMKGAQSLVAQQCKETVICEDAPPNLATAGSGDVLSGIIAGLMAQGMDGYGASCAGVWIHSKAAESFGYGLVSSDLPDLIPSIVQELCKNYLDLANNCAKTTN